MSTEAYTWVRRLRRDDLGGITDAARLTLYELAEYASPDGTGVYPSVGRLAEQREVSERTIQRHLRDLEGAGLIVRGDQRKAEWIMPANVRPTVYDLAMEPVENLGERGDMVVTPLIHRGDTKGQRGVTSGVTQTKNLTLETSVTYSGTERASKFSTDDGSDPIDEPDRQCFHGFPVEYVGKPGHRVPRCPTCRRRGYLDVMPDRPEPTPEKQAQTMQLLEQVRNRGKVQDA